MSKYWIQPSMGLFFGVTNANKDREEGGSGGLVLGNIVAQIGGLLGGIIGWGEKWGIYTGISGALALIPFLGFGFIGIPIGIHFRKKIGLGLIIPIYMTEWYIGLIAGVIVFLLATKFKR